MMWWNDGGWGAGQWIAMTLGMLLFWGLIAFVVYWVIRTLRSDSPPVQQTPDQILAERFARGEITADEYETARATLHGQGVPLRKP